MNPALFLIGALALVALWFLLSFTFFPLGKVIHKIGKDAIDGMNKDDVKENKESKENVEEEK